MTPNQIALVQRDFADLRTPAAAATLAACFYRRLFALAPDTERLFSTDLAVQGQKLIATLAAVVDGLALPDEILPVARALAVRHVRYGVADRHYDAAGAALLGALERRRGRAWTVELEAAWAAAYQEIADEMRAAALLAA